MRIRSFLRGNLFIPNYDANIDPNDDSIDRWLVWHYRYDPERRERRNVVIACFDNRRAFMKCIKRSGSELEVAKAEGRSEKKERIGVLSGRRATERR